MKKYRIELTEDQLIIVSNCLEDISRFASGQCEMQYTIAEMLRGLPFDEKIKRREQFELLFRQAKSVLLPELRENERKSYNSTDFIGNTYQIYRTILHQLAKDNIWDNVYSSPPLPSGNMGTVKIEKV